MKLLVIGDGNSPTGFGRVTHSILERLPGSTDIHHLGINHRGDPHGARWPIYPAGLNGDIYGLDRVGELVQKIRPDLVFAVCDPWILTRYAAALEPFRKTVRTVFYTPVEGMPVEPAVALGLRNVDRLVAYTQFGARALEESFRAAAEHDPVLSVRPIDVIPHGVDTKIFRPLGAAPFGDRAAARKQLLPDSPDFQDAFIVLNANRNQPRKRIDLTMQGFARFAQDKPANVKLYLHMGLEDCGWNLFSLARRFGIEERLILTTTEPQLASEPVEKLNLIYNACDVGINTATGEGWGLIAFEHAATGAAQIVPRHTSCEELWQGAAELMEPSFTLTGEKILIEEHYVMPETIAASLETLYRDADRLRLRQRQAYENATRPEYDWDRIAGQWNDLFEEVLATHPACRAAA